MKNIPTFETVENACNMSYSAMAAKKVYSAAGCKGHLICGCLAQK